MPVAVTRVAEVVSDLGAGNHAAAFGICCDRHLKGLRPRVVAAVIETLHGSEMSGSAKRRAEWGRDEVAVVPIDMMRHANRCHV